MVASNLFGAGFDSFPVPTSSWYVIDGFEAIEELYEAGVERYEVIGETAPNIIETWTVFDKITTNDIVFWTNITYDTMEWTTTNQFGPFEYENSASITMTGMPFVTYNTMLTLDTMVENLSSKFAAGSMVSDSFTEYFDLSYVGNKTNGVGAEQVVNTVDIYPQTSFLGLRESLGNLLYQLDIGNVTAPITNEFGYVTNYAKAGFTRMPPVTNRYPLTEWYYTTNSIWITNKIGKLISDTVRHYIGTNDYPSVQYKPSETFTGSYTLNLTGTIYKAGATLASSESVLISSTNYIDLTNQWNEINSSSITGGTPSTNDTIVVLYTNKMGMYGSRAWRLFAQDLNERWTALKNMDWTVTSGEMIGGDSVGVLTLYEGYGAVITSYADAKATNIADWASSLDGGKTRIYQWQQDSVLTNVGFDFYIVDSQKETDFDELYTPTTYTFPVTITQSVTELFFYEYDQYWGRRKSGTLIYYYTPVDLDGVAEGTRAINKTYLVESWSDSNSLTNTFDLSAFDKTTNPVEQHSPTVPVGDEVREYYLELEQSGGSDNFESWYHKWNFTYK